MLKSLLGNSSRDRELSEEMRAVLKEMREERARYEALLENSSSATERLQQLADPLAKAGSDVNAVTARLADLEARLAAFAPLANQVEALDERARGVVEHQDKADAEMTQMLENSQQVRMVFEELKEKVDVAVGLKDRLEAFLEVEKPFSLLRGEADDLRGQVESTAEHMTRLREQHDRLLEAHKSAMAKMEALDRRRDELGRDLQDKERRVIGVDQAVRGMDGVRTMVEDVRRDLGTLKALGDSLAQKTSSLEAQSEAADRALAQAESLERAMKQIDAGVRQQYENEKALGSLQDTVVSLKHLHEEVVERSAEITQLQRQTEEQASHIRHELKAAQDEMKNSVERFDFEAQGLETVSQRVADLRGGLADFENRYKGLREAGQTVGELNAQTQTLQTQMRGLLDESQRIDEEVRKLHLVRRELDEAGQRAQYLSAQIARMEESKPAVESALRDFEKLAGAHATVRDTLEQSRNAGAEIARMRQSQGETRDWLIAVERSVGELREQVAHVQNLSPALELVQRQTDRIHESMGAIERQREGVGELQKRLAEIATLGGELDERGQRLQQRMGAAEQRFQALEAHSTEADRMAKLMADVTASVQDAQRRHDEIGQSVAASASRCESIEELAERTQSLKAELDQRREALDEAAGNLAKASKTRQEAAQSAKQLEDLSKSLSESLSSAEVRMAGLDEMSTQLEQRVHGLRTVDSRLAEFEERLAKWEVVDQEVARTLAQISARQGTVQALQTDLDRMFAMAEKTTTDVRAIAAAQRQVAETRTLVDDVVDRIQVIEKTASTLDDRKRQMAKAEDRLARAESFLVDVRSSLEALQGQKAMVEQAVEKAGALRFLLKQAEGMLEGLREERKMTTNIRDALSIVRDDDGDERHGQEEETLAA